MAVDAYSPCPCGSGKKFKFCCLKIADEMEKVVRLQENRQSHAALQALERLEREQPGYPWISIAKGSVLLGEGRDREALETLHELLEREPEHHFALALAATSALTALGYSAGKPLLYRALQRCSDVYPDMIAGLAMGIASLMLRDLKFMACRQYLTLAMRLVPEQDQQEVFVRLLEFDSDATIPYPLRSVHYLAESTGSEEHQKESRKGLRLAAIGCYEAAAKVFTRLAEQEPERAELWQNAGFCRAWDGDETRAAEALHKAARHQSDFEAAVECETIAQLLDQQNTSEQVKATSHRYRLQSVGRLLSRLDEHPRLARLETPPPSDDEAEQGAPTAIYNLIDRPVDPMAELTQDTLPNVLAQLMIVDENRAESRSPYAYVVSFEGEMDRESQSLFEEAAGEDAVSDPEPDENEPVLEAIPRDAFTMMRRWHYPPGTPVVRRRKLEREHWERVAREIWPQMPLSALGGKTPREAAGDKSLRLPLYGAVYVLDAFCERNQQVLDVARMARDLNLPEPQVIEVTDQLPLHSFSAMQFNRLPPDKLSDGQVIYTLNRALLIHHAQFLYDVLVEALDRPSCVGKIDLDRTYLTLSQLCRDRGRREEAAQWIAKGREHAEHAEKPFEAVLKWAMHELTFRLEDPQDPALRPLLQHIVQYYTPKLPRLTEYLEELLVTFGMTAELGLLSDETAGAATPGGLWTPQSESGSAVKKLWLPGQD